MLIAISESRRPRRDSVHYPVNAGLYLWRNNVAEVRTAPNVRLRRHVEVGLAASGRPRHRPGPKQLDVPPPDFESKPAFDKLKSAKAVGLELPATVLARADEVIE